MAKINTLTLKTPLKDELTISLLQGHETLGRLFQYQLELSSHNEEIDIDDILGQSVTVHFDDGADGVRYFNGIVSSFSQTGQLKDSGASYQATLRPWLWFLTRTADCRIFQELSVPDIIKQVFQDQGFSDIQDELQEEHKVWGYCVQYRETDFNFVSRLMEEEGIYYYFVHEDGKHTLVLADSGSAHQPVRDDAVMYYPVANANPRSEQCISSWLIRREVQPGACVVNDYDFRRPKAALRQHAQIQKKHAASEYEVYDYPGEYAERFEGSTGEYADIRIQELHVQQDQVEGVTDLRIMATGGLFTLDSHPRKDQNKEYLVVDSSCEISLYGDSGGILYQCQFTAIDSQIPFRPARVTPKPVVQGPQTAVVVGPEGESIWPDKYGRVKVQFHWDRHAQDEDSKENSSCWVRVSQNSAGGPTGSDTGSKNWGSMFLPHVDDEVIVDFLEGDPDRPIITGRVFNADNMPLEELPAEKHMSGFRDVYGNEIIMDSTPGDEHIRLHSPHHDSTLELGRSVKYKTSSDWNTFTKGNSADCRIGYKQSLTVGASTTQMLGLSSSVFVGGKVDVTVAAAISLTAGVKYSADIGGSISHAYSYSYKHVKSKEISKNNAEYVKHAEKEVRFDSEERVFLVGGTCDAAIVAVGKRAKTGPDELVLSFGKGTTNSGLVSDSATSAKMWGAAVSGAVATLGATAAGAAGAAMLFNTQDDTGDPTYQGRNMKNLGNEWLIPTMAAGGTVAVAAGGYSIKKTKSLMKKIGIDEPTHTTTYGKITLDTKGVTIESDDGSENVVSVQSGKDIIVKSKKANIGLRAKTKLSLWGESKVIIGDKLVSIRGEIKHNNLTVSK